MFYDIRVSPLGYPPILPHDREDQTKRHSATHPPFVLQHLEENSSMVKLAVLFLKRKGDLYGRGMQGMWRIIIRGKAGPLSWKWSEVCVPCVPVTVVSSVNSCFFVTETCKFMNYTILWMGKWLSPLISTKDRTLKNVLFTFQLGTVLSSTAI